MKNIKYYKAEPSEYVRFSSNGKVKKAGTGISKIYMPFRTSVEMIAISAKEQPFAFSEISNDNQSVSIQGGFIYRIENPDLTFDKYNLSIDPQTKRYHSEDSMKLPEHILNLVQSEARKIAQTTKLEKLLTMSDELSASVLDKLKESPLVSDLGVTLDTVYMTSIRPKPEITKALEANYREDLLQKADEAIYARRALAIENERAIQENEMKTKVEIEEKRKKLVKLESENILKQAETKAEATKKQIEAKKKEFEIFESMEPQKLAALGFYHIGKNASRIGNLSITPELLTSLVEGINK